MGIPNVMETGRQSMVASKASIATAGHNIANAGTEGYSRQRVQLKSNVPSAGIGGKGVLGQGVLISRVERINDEYLDRQIRTGSRMLAHFEEKDASLRQLEDVFNELDGQGLNRVVAKFFNEFRNLSNEPNNEAIRQSVREASRGLVNDVRRMRKQVQDIQSHIDARLENYSNEINSYAAEIKDLNVKIKQMEIGGAPPNDLLDQRDLAVKKLSDIVNIATHKDKDGAVYVDVLGAGPLVAGPVINPFSTMRTQADPDGKPENSVDLAAGDRAKSIVTHQLSGGKIGALLEVRDRTLATVVDKLDELAFGISTTVNQIHRQGFTRDGLQGVGFFTELSEKDRAAELFDLSDDIKSNINSIATAALPNAPGDNRIALAISGIQHQKLLNDGHATLDDWYNSIVSDIGVASARNREAMNQQKGIVTSLDRMRDQISGVSLDEETANLLQFQHAFDASAKVIKVADEMLDTILSLR